MSYSRAVLSAFTDAIGILCAGGMRQVEPALRSALGTALHAPEISVEELRGDPAAPPPLAGAAPVVLSLRLEHAVARVSLHRASPVTDDDGHLLNLLQGIASSCQRGCSVLVASGDAPSVLRPVENREEQDFHRLHALGLTARECEVAYWLEQGKRDSEIAAIVGVATKTVSKHVEHILAKLGVETRFAAVHAARTWLRQQT